MASKYYIQKGLLIKKADQKDDTNLFDFSKLIENELDRLNVASFNECCDTAGTDPQPVQFDPTTGSLQTFNGTSYAELSAGISANSMLAGFFPLVAQNDITAGTGGAIVVTNYLTTINTDAGGDAFTLADGVQVGQLKKILLVADGGGNAVITPVNLSGGTTITMNDAGDYVVLIWDGTDWVTLENSGSTIA